jgi:molybdenum cofactor synthesis domain-containing protein
MIAGLAAFGYNAIKVGRRPKLSVLATGSEIVAVNERPGRDQIRNSNSPTVKALGERFGGVVDVMPIAPDDILNLRSEISEATSVSDIVVITGGVSVGKYDLTKTALADLGAEILFERIRLKPGKPTVFATLGDKLIFGLPGNPVSVAMTFHLFVRPAILLAQGCDDVEMPQGHAIAGRAVKGTKERDSYLPATLKTDRSGRLIADPINWHGSSDFVGFARAEVSIIVPKGRNFERGEVVRIAYL